MIALALLLLTAADLDRFPALDAYHARLRVLIEQRFQLGLREPTPERERLLQLNAYRLACWEALLEARGGLAEEGGADDEATRRAALERLRGMLGEREWRAGRMP